MVPDVQALRGQTDNPWLPLGSASLIDWKQLGGASSARGAMAFAARIEGEPVLARTWTNESTTFYEFHFLAYEGMHGTLVVSTTRLEDTRLRLTATVDVEGRLGYSDVSEFLQHPRTGLYGSIVRTVEVTSGELATEPIASPTSAEAEIFEFAPESALLTSCGLWIASVLAAVKRQLVDGEEQEPARGDAPAPRVASLDEEPTPAAQPKPRRKAPPKKRTLPRPTEAPPAARTPAPARPPTPEPEEPPMMSDAPSKLIATANTGETWEIEDDETFLGRSKQCSIVLKSQRVSRKHASITREDDGFYINDLGAANGIWAGPDKVDRERIEDASEYIIGDVLVTFTHA